MTPEQRIKQFTKYIDKIVKPKFPDILEVEISHERSIGIPVYDFTFIMDGTEYEIEEEIKEEIFYMKELFGEKFLARYKFETY